MERPDKVLTVFGSARTKKDDIMYIHAEEVGKLLADEGIGVATGGGACGIMEASSKGCYENEGYVEAYAITLPFEEGNTEYSHDTYIYAHFSQRQRDLMNASSIGYLVFPGGAGSLYELMYLITEISCKKRNTLPVILYNTEFWQRLINFSFWLDQKMISYNTMELISFVDKPEDIIEILNK